MFRTRPFQFVVLAFVLFSGAYLFYFRYPSDVKIVQDLPPSPPVLPPGEPYTAPVDNSETYKEPTAEKPEPSEPAVVPSKDPRPQTATGTGTHTIDDLVKDADTQFDAVLARQSHSLKDAAAAYRARRGRHPPPGFDLWFKYATENDAVIVEDFWDQIYHDLDPFWALEPPYIRAQARRLGMGVEIKDGKVVAFADWFWHKIWGRMIDTVAEHLPNMFIAMNPMDESRLLVTWEKMTEYVTKANEEKIIPKAAEVIRKVRGWNSDDEEAPVELPDDNWNGFNPYNYARRACAPDSAARQVGGILSPEEILAYRDMKDPKVDVQHYFDGSFVTNYTEASDFCSDASIGGLHGALMLPLTCKNSDVLMPMFGGSKFHVNNEILVPAPMYWNDEERFGGDGADVVSWKDKDDKAIWRGTATGGRNKPFTWYMYHRHRFVAMTNGTRYRNADKKGHDLIFNELLQESAIKQLNPRIQEHFGDWLSSTHNVAFTNLVCDEPQDDGSCWYTADEYTLAENIPFSEHFATKYLPDIDGNSFSGRYRAFLLSNSLPLKATIYREWHDSRLFAWKHFVPMNNRFSDYYSIMEYFLGDVARGVAGRDDQAEKIALEGRKWAEKVLRKEDMQIYVLRLLLEYGRITDDRRLEVGWVDDLI